MAIKTTLTQSSPALHTVCRKVEFEQTSSSEIQQVITDLVDTMRHEGLIAMAAPQIGVSLRIFITEIRATKSRPSSELDEFRVYINPEIIELSKETSELYEGCGSVIGIKRFGPVIRPAKVSIKAWNEKGKEFILTCNGLLARAIQHEVDHLNGKEFTSRMSQSTELVTPEVFKDKVSITATHQAATKTTIKKLSFSTTA